MPKTTTPQEPDPSQPVGTPPGGGRWTWSAEQRAWVPLPEPQTPPQE